MTRRQVPIADLPSLFESLFNKRIEPVRREAEGLCDKVQDWLAEVKDTGSKLLKEQIEDDLKEAKSSISSADRFGRKIIDMVEAIQAPNEMTYNSLVDYTNTLRNFQSQIMNAASIWIPKLPLRLKRTIRELEAKMKLLGHSVNSLESHVSGKHRQLNKLEKILEDSKLLLSLQGELKNLDSIIKTHEQNLVKLDMEIADIDRVVNELDLDEVSRKLGEQERQLGGLGNQIREIFQPLEKPIEKLLKTTDSKKGLLPSDALATLQRYVDDPIGTIQNEEHDQARLRSSLEALRNVLTSGSIDLKESRVKNALKSISEICSSSTLETLRQSYRQMAQEYHETSSSNEAVQIANRKRELEGRRQRVINEKSRLDFDMKILSARRNELTLRVSRLKTDLEERSRLTADEEIEILMES